MRRLKNERIEMIEKWKDRNDFNFPCLCLVRGVEKLRDGKLICLVENKSEGIENIVCIKSLSCPYCII